MKEKNNCDKSRLIKLFTVLNMLQQPHCFINFNKTSKKISTNIKHKNKISNNSNVKKTIKEMNINYTLSLPKATNKDSSEFILPTQKLIIKDDTEFIKKEDELTTHDCIYDIRRNINTTNSKNLISTFPIIIAEKSIYIPIESTFRLKNAALDIKSMKKDLYLTNSKLLPMYEKDDISPSSNGKLFLEGFVRNKIDFSIAKGVHDSIINLDTESLIIYIPFKCTTLIHYKTPPIFSKQKTLDYIPIYVSSDCIDINKGYDEYIDCSVPLINCEIEKAKIYETYTLVDKTPFNKDFPMEINFNTIKENIIIDLSLTLLQEQDVAMNCSNNPK